MAQKFSSCSAVSYTHLEGACVVAVDLVLAVAAFVMAVLRAHAHLLHGQADVPAEVLALSLIHIFSASP